jgi:hypothetical protein
MIKTEQGDTKRDNLRNSSNVRTRILSAMVTFVFVDGPGKR